MSASYFTPGQLFAVIPNVHKHGGVRTLPCYTTMLYQKRMSDGQLYCFWQPKYEDRVAPPYDTIMINAVIQDGNKWMLCVFTQPASQFGWCTELELRQMLEFYNRVA